MRIADVLRAKGGSVVTINPDATVTELLAGLAGHNIGAMVVEDPTVLWASSPSVTWFASCTPTGRRFSRDRSRKS